MVAGAWNTSKELYRLNRPARNLIYGIIYHTQYAICLQLISVSQLTLAPSLSLYLARSLPFHHNTMFLGRLVYCVILIVNAIAVLSEDRFLARSTLP